MFVTYRPYNPGCEEDRASVPGPGPSADIPTGSVWGDSGNAPPARPTFSSDRLRQLRRHDDVSGGKTGTRESPILIVAIWTYHEDGRSFRFLVLQGKNIPAAAFAHVPFRLPPMHHTVIVLHRIEDTDGDCRALDVKAGEFSRY